MAIPHKLTLAQMHAIIDSGESVMHDGRIISSKAALPSEADMAGDDEHARNLAMANLEARQKAIDAEMALLSRPKSDPVKAAPGKPIESQASTASSSAPAVVAPHLKG